jgi:hypothetical protein
MHKHNFTCHFDTKYTVAVRANVIKGTVKTNPTTLAAICRQHRACLTATGSRHTTHTNEHTALTKYHKGHSMSLSESIYCYCSGGIKIEIINLPLSPAISAEPLLFTANSHQQFIQPTAVAALLKLNHLSPHQLSCSFRIALFHDSFSVVLPSTYQKQ